MNAEIADLKLKWRESPFSSVFVPYQLKTVLFAAGLEVMDRNSEAQMVNLKHHVAIYHSLFPILLLYNLGQKTDERKALVRY